MELGLNLAVNPSMFMAFVMAVFVLALIPGPIVTLVVANSIAYGTRSALINLSGTLSGNAVFFMIAGFGMTWAINLLTDWLLVIQLLGACYLVYLGLMQWLKKSSDVSVPVNVSPQKSFFVQGFIVAITNPKMIVFYAAFFPQFMDPSIAYSKQLIVMTSAALTVALVVDAAYILLAGQLRPYLISQKRELFRNRIAGSVLILTGTVIGLTQFLS